MVLEDNSPGFAQPTDTSATSSEALDTLDTALGLLASLRPRVLAILENQPLRIPLEVLDIM